MYNRTLNIHHERRSLRYPGWDYSSSAGYFVTSCTHEREYLFGRIENGKVLLSEYGHIVSGWWKQLAQKYPLITLDEWVIMPNHFHGIVWLNQRSGTVRKTPTLGHVIGYFKYQSTVSVNALRGSVCARVWQRNYHDRIIRNDHELKTIRQYIRDNPSKWEDDEYAKRFNDQKVADSETRCGRGGVTPPLPHRVHVP